jgi:hypothetical protein
VTLNDISFTDVPANMDISGTIDKHTMRLAEGVTVTGDITISDNLILSKISDDGVGITLTNDSSTRTITGSGSIEASTLAQTPNASLTGMTGTIGTSVLSTATFEGTLNSSTTFSGDAGKKTAKAWVNFDGTASGATISSSYNVSGVDDDGTGKYTIHWEPDMSTATSYVVVGTCGDTPNPNDRYTTIGQLTADSSWFWVSNYAGNMFDAKYCMAVAFGA